MNIKQKIYQLNCVKAKQNCHCPKILIWIQKIFLGQRHLLFTPTTYMDEDAVRILEGLVRPDRAFQPPQRGQVSDSQGVDIGVVSADGVQVS